MTTTFSREALRPELIARLGALLDAAGPLLSEYDYAAAQKFMAERAYTLTYEHICEQFYEFQTPIPPDLYAALADLGHDLGYRDDAHWADLAAQVR